MALVALIEILSSSALLALPGDIFQVHVSASELIHVPRFRTVSEGPSVLL